MLKKCSEVTFLLERNGTHRPLRRTGGLAPCRYFRHAEVVSDRFLSALVEPSHHVQTLGKVAAIRRGCELDAKIVGHAEMLNINLGAS